MLNITYNSLCANWHLVLLELRPAPNPHPRPIFPLKTRAPASTHKKVVVVLADKQVLSAATLTPRDSVKLDPVDLLTLTVSTKNSRSPRSAPSISSAISTTNSSPSVKPSSAGPNSTASGSVCASLDGEPSKVSSPTTCSPPRQRHSDHSARLQLHHRPHLHPARRAQRSHRPRRSRHRSPQTRRSRSRTQPRLFNE